MDQKLASVPRVAAINDISGFGRCSLTVAIPILSVMGIQCCPIPTAVLSQHTGFQHFYFCDLTPHLSPYMESWKSQGLLFDTVYSGFLGSEEQIRLVDGFIAGQKGNPMIFIDPVMGDDGEIYATYTPKMCEEMRELVRKADIVTPNLTEACLLTNTPYTGESPDLSAAKEMAAKLAEMGPAYAVITGLRKDGQIASLAYDRKKQSYDLFSVERIDAPYLGTGDIFASVLCGCLTKGQSLPSALSCACRFVLDTTRYTKELGSPVMDGIAFEPLLYQLGGKRNERE